MVYSARAAVSFQQACPVCLSGVKPLIHSPVAAVGFLWNSSHPKPRGVVQGRAALGVPLAFDATLKCNQSPVRGRMLGFLSGRKQKCTCRLVKAAPPAPPRGLGSPLKGHLKLLGRIMTTGNGCLNNTWK